MAELATTILEFWVSHIGSGVVENISRLLKVGSHANGRADVFVGKRAGGRAMFYFFSRACDVLFLTGPPIRPLHWELTLIFLISLVYPSSNMTSVPHRESLKTIQPRGMYLRTGMYLRCLSFTIEAPNKIFTCAFLT